MRLAAPAEARPIPPAPNPEPHKKAVPSPRGQVLIFTLREECPARLGPEDLSDPRRYHQRLQEWLLRQK